MAAVDDAIQSYVDANYDELVDMIEANAVDADALASAIEDEVMAYIDSLDLEALRSDIEEALAPYAEEIVAQANDYTDSRIDDVYDQMGQIADQPSVQTSEPSSSSRSSGIVSAPDFVSTARVSDEGDYASAREAEREAAIQSIFSAIAQ